MQLKYKYQENNLVQLIGSLRIFFCLSLFLLDENFMLFVI